MAVTRDEQQRLQEIRIADLPLERAAKQLEDETAHLGQESPKIVDDASKLGAKRLIRPTRGHAITSFAGGMSVSFGAVAMVAASSSVGGGIIEPSMGLLMGALLFPIGFVILLIGKTELFTENFLIPVVAVVKKRGSIFQLTKLWGITLLFNLLGAIVFGYLISRGDVLAGGSAEEMRQLALHKVNYNLETAFIKSIFAGWLMTTLTWLLISAKGIGSQLAIMWMIAALIVLGQFIHVVISSSEVFMGMFLGADITVMDWFLRSFLPSLVGNLLGGLIFVTLIGYVQSLYHQPVTDTESLDEAIGI